MFTRCVILLACLGGWCRAGATIFEFGTVSGSLTIHTDPARNFVRDVQGAYGQAGRLLRLGDLSGTLTSPGGAQDQGSFNSETGELSFACAWSFTAPLTDAATGAPVATITHRSLFLESGRLGADGSAVMSGDELPMNQRGEDQGAIRKIWEWFFGTNIVADPVPPIIVNPPVPPQPPRFASGQMTDLTYRGSLLSDPFEMLIFMGDGLGGGAVAGTATGTVRMLTVPAPGACALAAAAGMCFLRRRR